MDLKKKILIAISIVIILILIFFSFGKNSSSKLSVTRGPLVEAVYALGRVKSDETFVLKFGITSSIREIWVEEGQSVAKGQKLLQNDSGVVFSSPIQGTVTKLTVFKNETTMPGIPILEVQNLKSVYISVSLDQESAIRVKRGQRVQMSFESMRTNVYEAEVERVYPSNGQFLVRIEPKNLPDGILPDMTTDVAIQVSEKEDVILVPLVAVNRGKVVRLRDGKKTKIEVKIGAINSEFGELINGDLLPGDEVLLKN